jgi:hypothetical protein
MGALVLAAAASGACAPDDGMVTTPDGGALDAGRLDAASDLGVDVGFDRVSTMDAPADVGATGDGAAAEVLTPECRATSDCTGGRLCRLDRCVEPTTACSATLGCPNDARCEGGRCVPFGATQTDPACTVDPRPGVFAPAVQCQFDEAPAGDAYPEHLHVLSTPMVADLRVYHPASAGVRPSLVVVFDDGSDGGSEEPSGLIRVLDGRTCALQDNLSEQLVSHSSPPAVGDLDGDGTPEIVAFKAGGGLVAFRYVAAAAGDAGARGRWGVWWRSTSSDGTAFNPTGGGWAGPTIVDIDGDGRAEVLRHGMVFNGQTGVLVGGTGARSQLAGYSAGAFSVALDVDEDGAIELVTGDGVFAWSATTHEWVRETYFARSNCAGAGCGDGHVAVADFGDYSTARFPDGRVPELAVVSSGYVRIDTIEGRTVFGPVALPGGGTGGAPTVADFDGDGLAEVAAAGATAYSVMDPDCGPRSVSRAKGRCVTATSTGVLWSRPSQDSSSNVTGSTSFDFEGDGRVEAVYADECFARVYDGATGTVLFSQQHSSCTWYENPVVADVDGDFRAELVVGSNFNCGSPTTGIACPGVGERGVDVQFAGLRCSTGAECPSGRCVSGFCRCTADGECCPGGAPAGDGGVADGGDDAAVEDAGGADAGGDAGRTTGSGSGECTYVCAAPPEGTAGEGNTCRAARPRGVRGIRVYADIADRWVRSRTIWNQHAYNVTNVEDDGRVPASGSVRLNWRERTLNNFRTNVQGTAEITSSPDGTVAGTGFACMGSGAARMTVRACNRGTSPMADGLPVGFYSGSGVTLGARVCGATTPRALMPGECVDVTCDWTTPPQDRPTPVTVLIDDTRTRTECHEENNLGTIEDVICRAPG